MSLTGQMGADGDRSELFATLALSPQLALVYLTVTTSGGLVITSAELRVLAAVHVRELVLKLRSEQSLALLTIRSDQLYCLLPLKFADWDAITAQAGIFVVPSVTDASLDALLSLCAGAPPDLIEGWALVLMLLPHQRSAHVLKFFSTRPCFRPGTKDWRLLVKCNTAVSDATLDRSLRLLHVAPF